MKNSNLIVLLAMGLQVSHVWSQSQNPFTCTKSNDTYRCEQNEPLVSPPTAGGSSAEEYNLYLNDNYSCRLIAEFQDINTEFARLEHLCTHNTDANDYYVASEWNKSLRGLSPENQELLQRAVASVDSETPNTQEVVEAAPVIEVTAAAEEAAPTEEVATTEEAATTDEVAAQENVIITEEPAVVTITEEPVVVTITEDRTGEVEAAPASVQTHCSRVRPVTSANSEESENDEAELVQEEASLDGIMAQINSLNESVRALQQMTNMLMMFSMFNQNSIQFFPTAAQQVNPMGSLASLMYGQMMSNLMSSNLPSANIAGAQAAQPTYQIMGDLNFLGNGLGQMPLMNAPQALNQMGPMNSQTPFGYNFDADMAATSPMAIL